MDAGARKQTSHIESKSTEDGTPVRECGPSDKQPVRGIADRSRAKKKSTPHASTQRACPIACSKKVPKQTKQRTDQTYNGKKLATGETTGKEVPRALPLLSSSYTDIKFPTSPKREIYSLAAPTVNTSGLTFVPVEFPSSSRIPSLSPTVRQRGTSLSPISPRGKLHVTSPSLSPLSKTSTPDSKKQFLLAPKGSRMLVARDKTTAPSLVSIGCVSQDLVTSLTDISVNYAGHDGTLADEDECENKESSFPCTSTPRDIFSPVPLENAADEEAGYGLSSYGPWDNDTDLDHNASSFPSIKVEGCDEPLAATPCHAADIGRAKRSDAIITFMPNTDMDWSSAGMISLNVPSALVEKRTTDGRLIVGVNEVFSLTGAFSKMWSRSEGNIPYALREQGDHTHTSLLSNPGTGQVNPIYTQQNYRTQSAQASTKSVYAHVDSHRHQQLLSPSLQPELVSKPKIRMYPEQNVNYVRKNIRFHSPQPQRKLHSKYQL